MRFKIERELKDIDLVAMSRTELMDLKLYVDTQRDGVQAALELAKITFHTTGEPMDPQRLQRTRHAYRMRTREIQAIENELSRRKREESKALAQAFIDQARLLLDGEVFMTIMVAAQDVAADNQALQRAQQL
jgi:hypothetical protein